MSCHCPVASFTFAFTMKVVMRDGWRTHSDGWCMMHHDACYEGTIAGVAEGEADGDAADAKHNEHANTDDIAKLQISWEFDIVFKYVALGVGVLLGVWGPFFCTCVSCLAVV